MIDKRWLLACGLVVGVCLVIIFLVPFFISADAFRPTIESQLSAGLGRNVTIGKLSFSLMRGSLSAEDIAISDDPSFSSVPFMQAHKLDVGIEVIPFLLHKQVRITSLKMDAPSIQLIDPASGTLYVVGPWIIYTVMALDEADRGPAIFGLGPQHRRIRDCKRQCDGFNNPGHREAIPIHRSKSHN